MHTTNPPCGVSGENKMKNTKVQKKNQVQFSASSQNRSDKPAGPSTVYRHVEETRHERTGGEGAVV